METKRQYGLFNKPGPEDMWSESWDFSFVGDEISGFLRVGFYPNQGTANIWLFYEDNQSIYWFRDEEIDRSKTHGLIAWGDNWHLEIDPETGADPRRVHRFQGEVTRSDTLSELLDEEGQNSYLELEWTAQARTDPFYYSQGHTWPERENFDRYEQACAVYGTTTIGNVDPQIKHFECPGRRDHSHGIRDWSSGNDPWITNDVLWTSGGFEDGSAYNVSWVKNSDPPFFNGYWFDGTNNYPIIEYSVSMSPEYSRSTIEDWLEGDAPTYTYELAWGNDNKREECTVEIEPERHIPFTWEGERKTILIRSPSVHKIKHGSTEKTTVRGLGKTDMMVLDLHSLE